MARRRPRARRDAEFPRFVVLTGLSGSGKSHAIRALEDLGYFCVDNLPVTLLADLAGKTLVPSTEIERAAVVVDVREGSLLSQFPRVYRGLKRTPGLRPVLVFLEATDSVLIRRFSETRRPHPLAGAGSVVDGIREERKRLAPLRKLADEWLDTSDMTVHELREAFLAVSRGRLGQRKPVVTLLSFGFKHGVPTDADLVFDVRFLPNPHFVGGLRKKTGLDRPVVRFLDDSPETGEFLEKTTDLLQFLLPRYVREGKSYVTIAVGCTGGRHRSVAVAEALRERLDDLDAVRLRVRHRDIAHE